MSVARLALAPAAGLAATSAVACRAGACSSTARASPRPPRPLESECLDHAWSHQLGLRVCRTADTPLWGFRWEIDSTIQIVPRICVRWSVVFRDVEAGPTSSSTRRKFRWTSTGNGDLSCSCFLQLRSTCAAALLRPNRRSFLLALFWINTRGCTREEGERGTDKRVSSAAQRLAPSVEGGVCHPFFVMGETQSDSNRK